MRRQLAKITTVAALGLLALASPAAAQVQPYGTNDYGGFRNVLPPGQGTSVNGAGLFSFEVNGTLPPHYDDQRLMYQNLIHATPGLTNAQIGNYYKDGSFGVKPADVARTYMPDPAGHSGLTVVRDNYGVPHIYGTTRADVMFGTGYVGAEDRLFFMDVLRHAGRAELSSFAGGSNRAMDAQQWDVAPYTEHDLQKQFDFADEVYGAEGVKLQQDVTDYVAGINKRIADVQADPVNKMPGEYAALGQTLAPWKITDVIATASLIGGIFGKGGGGELGNAEVLESAIAKYGSVSEGTQAWEDFRRANDPEAPTTVHNGQTFPYQDRPGTDPFTNPAVAMPKPGSLVDGSPDDAGAAAPLDGILGPLRDLTGASNALLVSAAHAQSGHPEIVFGPQVGYFAPEILMEEDLHGPDIDARGATFVGVNLYVLLGRGQDYAWSATSAGQDIIDTFAEKLCEPGGGTPTINSMHYLYKGQCIPIEVLNRDQVILPRGGDTNGLGPYHLQAQRTVHGIVSKRGFVKVNDQDVPVAYTKLRSTYFHEADSARAFSDMNQPSKVQNATDFQHVMSKINFTFNWFYTDDKDIAYFNSGDNPVRATGTDPEFPTWGTGDYDWQGWDPVTDPGSNTVAGGTNIADYTPFDEHPQVINQDYLSSWNNKQAPGYRAAEDNYAYGPNHRVQSLNERIEAGISDGKKMSLADLISAMEDGGSVDLRGSQDLGLMLDVIESSGSLNPAESDAVSKLRAWVAAGAHRRDNAPQDGRYDHSEAIAIMDSWWPKALDAAFKPTLGADLFDKVHAQLEFDDPPGPTGSAYIDGWEGYVNKDLRDLLGRSVLDPFSRGYCGDGVLAACRTALLSSLDSAIQQAKAHRDQLYPEAAGCLTPGANGTPGGGDRQMCHDAIRFTTVGAVSVKPIEWINRPTWQQAVEVQGHRDRSTPGGGDGGGTGGGTSGSGTPGTSTLPAPAGGTQGAHKKCRKSHRAASAKKRHCRKKKRR
ncbi:MAG: penicillin acylase family protein [Solirubrobacterales bacterium]